MNIKNKLPDGYELESESPDSVCFGNDKTHVIVRFSVKPIATDSHSELKTQYAQDIETCAFIDGLEPYQLWQIFYENQWYEYDGHQFFNNGIYRRHPHADSIIEYHKCSDDDKKRLQIKCNGKWQNYFDDDFDDYSYEPDWDERMEYRIKPRTITIVVNGESKEYNAPLNVAPAIDDTYWVIVSNHNGYQAECTKWFNDTDDKSALEKNVAFATQEDCQLVVDAFGEILAGAQ